MTSEQPLQREHLGAAATAAQNRGLPPTSLIDSDLSEEQKLIGEIQALLLDKLSIRVETPEADLLQTGVLDSVAQVHLLLHLEKHFGLHLPMENLEIDSFLSVVNIAKMVANCARAQAAWPAPAKESEARRELIVEIQALFSEKLAIEVEAETDLFQSGIFDSMMLVQFILLLEDRFAFHMPLEELDVDSFNSVERIADLVEVRTRVTNQPNSLHARR